MIYGALVSRHFRDKSPGEPWSAAGESAHGFPSESLVCLFGLCLFGWEGEVPARTCSQPLLEATTEKEIRDELATVFHLSRSQALSRLAQQRLYQTTVSRMLPGNEDPVPLSGTPYISTIPCSIGAKI